MDCFTDSSVGLFDSCEGWSGGTLYHYIFFVVNGSLVNITYKCGIILRRNCIKMETKLTLSVDDELVKKAKKYAKSRNTSLSSIVESFFEGLIIYSDGTEEVISGEGLEGGFAELYGVLEGEDVSGLETKDSYAEHLIKKYS